MATCGSGYRLMQAGGGLVGQLGEARKKDGEKCAILLSTPLIEAKRAIYMQGGQVLYAEVS
jgi:hypothetical protein